MWCQWFDLTAENYFCDDGRWLSWSVQDDLRSSLQRRHRVYPLCQSPVADPKILKGGGGRRQFISSVLTYRKCAQRNTVYTFYTEKRGFWKSMSQWGGRPHRPHLYSPQPVTARGSLHAGKHVPRTPDTLPEDGPAWSPSFFVNGLWLHVSRVTRLWRLDDAAELSHTRLPDVLSFDVNKVSNNKCLSPKVPTRQQVIQEVA